jgi:hypothetical protein
MADRFFRNGAANELWTPPDMKITPNVRFVFALSYVILAIALLVFVDAIGIPRDSTVRHYWISLAGGVLAAGLVYVFSVVARGQWNPLWLVMGSDDELSVSLFQVALWTATFLFSFVFLWVDRFLCQGAFDFKTGPPPQNVLIAMGLSIFTALGAKGLRVAYGPRLSRNKNSRIRVPNASQLLSSDGSATSTPDLTKVQLLSWTVIAIVIYVVQTLHWTSTYAYCSASGTGDSCYPNIEDFLMWLMGFSQVTYLGNKFTSTPKPRVISIVPASGNAGDTVTIAGIDLGDEEGRVAFDQINAKDAVSWADTAIKLQVPNAQPAGGKWSPGTTVAIGVYVGGTLAEGTVTFTMT